MRGCGWAHEGYRSGRIVADDDVAVAYAPDDFRCLTVPLVNVRRWLEQLQTGGMLDRSTAARLLRLTRSVFYADRSRGALWHTWRRVLEPSGLRSLLDATGSQVTDVKAADAELALRACAATTPTRGGRP